MNWHHYFYEVFPAELAAFASRHPCAHHCPHCRAPRRRRALIHGLDLQAELSRSFRLSWYGVTLIDQGLFSRFSSDASQRWVTATGGYPLPVERSGFGCVRVVAPRVLLGAPGDDADWPGFVDFYLGEMASRLEPMSGVAPRAFMEGVAGDPDFNRPPNELEAGLLESARGRFGSF